MRRRIVWFTLFAAATLVMLLTRFYYGVQHTHWQDRIDARAAAAAQAGLVRVNDVQWFNGDAEYKVVTGSNDKGEKLIVWVGQDETHIEKASSGISAEAAQAALLQKAPDAEVLRVVPGKLHSDYVWELFYRRPEESGGERYYYDYVKFADGAHIDTYRLSLQ